MTAPVRLTATACSPKLIVLEWVRQYFLDWGASPCLNEIAEGTGSNKVRVRERLLALERDGELIYSPGKKRGIVLVNPADMLCRTEILLRAQALGLIPPGAAAVTNDNFPMPPGLDDIPSSGANREYGDGHDGDERMGGGAAAPHANSEDVG